MNNDFGLVIKNNYSKVFSRVPAWLRPLIPCFIALIVFAFALSFRINAKDNGSYLGEKAGSLTGKAVGSFEGITTGRKEGYEAGENEGLSAEDTEADLSTSIKKVANLEVLIASGTYSDVFKKGDSYAQLIKQKYNAVFTVNLKTADINLKEDGLHITLSQPKVDVYKVGDYEKVAEYDKSSLFSDDGNAEDGFFAALNSINKISEKITETLNNDENMIEAAKASAESQLKQLVNASSISKPEVYVEWRPNNG